MAMTEVKAAAKINLFLLVGSRGAGGYHQICSLMDKVSLFDVLRIGRRSTGFTVSGMDIPQSENLISKAVLALERLTGKTLAAEVVVDKHIPLAAGLAGGSSDAAAVMQELARAYGLDLQPGELEGPALEVGADVPFFLRSGPQLASGAGELMSRVTGLPAYHAVVAVPEAFLSTAAVYQLFDDMGGSEGFVQRVARQRDTLEALPDLPTLVSLMVNDLEPAATSQVPEIAVLKKELLSLGAAGALMSGSGPAVFGIFSRAADAQTAAARLSQDYRFVWAVDPLD